MISLSKYLFIVFLLVTSLSPQISTARDFDALVVPSLMDSDMDAWYRVPTNSGPNIHRAYKVTQGQMFNLLIFFKGYTADKSNNLHVTYDVQVYDPSGKPTDDNGKDILAYQGPMGNPEFLILNQQFLKIIFTEKYPLGTYKIKVTAYDKIANISFTTEAAIELIPFSIGDKFTSEKEFGEWLMGYYKDPTPTKAINGVLQFVQLDQIWLNKNLYIMSFFRRVFSDNSFLLKSLLHNFNTFSIDDKKKLLLVVKLSRDSSLDSFFETNYKNLYESTNELKIPDTDGVINTGDQLDILWSEFLATGKYGPIKKIVSALALSKYKGTLEKVKSGEIKTITKEIERQSYLEATYQAAIWSLISNCKQMPLVFKYCVYIYENETLDEDIKNQLGAILRVAQKEIQEESSKSKPGSKAPNHGAVSDAAKGAAPQTP
jgi:hypothetical protein